MGEVVVMEPPIGSVVECTRCRARFHRINRDRCEHPELQWVPEDSAQLRLPWGEFYWCEPVELDGPGEACDIRIAYRPEST